MSYSHRAAEPVFCRFLTSFEEWFEIKTAGLQIAFRYNPMQKRHTLPFSHVPWVYKEPMTDEVFATNSR